MNSEGNNKINWKIMLLVFIIAYFIFGSAYFYLSLNIVDSLNSYIIESRIGWTLFLFVLFSAFLFLINIILALVFSNRRKIFFNNFSIKFALFFLFIFLGYFLAYYSSEKFFPTREMNFKNNVSIKVYGNIPEKDIASIKKMFTHIGYIIYCDKTINNIPEKRPIYKFEKECISGDIEVQTEGGTYIYLIRKIDDKWKIIDKQYNPWLPYR